MNMTAQQQDLVENVFLRPGALWAGRPPTAITTVLGSSISVCLWDPFTGIGGISHFILASGGPRVSPLYGNHALPMLLAKVVELGANRERLAACVFGGASMLDGEGEGALLGVRNVAEAMEFLRRESITVLRQDVGGDAIRKLTFRTVDGATFVTKL